MSRTLSLARLLALPIACAAVAGCVDKNQSLMVVNFLAIDPSLKCQVMTNQTLGLSQGVYDVGLSRLLAAKNGYVAAPVLQNNLVPTGTAMSPERSFITVNGFEVELKDQQGNFILPAPDNRAYFVVSAVGAIEPGGGRAVATLELIPSSLLEAAFSKAGPGFNSMVVANVRAVGQQAGGDIQSAWFKFPVQVCDGCLAASPQAPCPVGGYDTSSILQGGCFATQDAPITCCTAKDVICGGGVPMKMSSTSGNDAGT